MFAQFIDSGGLLVVLETIAKERKVGNVFSESKQTRSGNPKQLLDRIRVQGSPDRVKWSAASFLSI